MLDHLLEEELWPAVAAPSRRRPKFPLQRPEGHIAQSLQAGAGRQEFLRSSPSGSPPVASEVLLDSSYFGDFRRAA